MPSESSAGMRHLAWLCAAVQFPPLPLLMWSLPVRLVGVDLPFDPVPRLKATDASARVQVASRLSP
jgi:hypothetical protein